MSVNIIIAQIEVDPNSYRENRIAGNSSKFKTSKNKKIFQKEDVISDLKKMASYLHRTAQPRTLAAFPPWGILQELVV